MWHVMFELATIVLRPIWQHRPAEHWSFSLWLWFVERYARCEREAPR